MTLTTRLPMPLPNACVEVRLPLTLPKSFAWCPSCGHELRVPEACPKHAPAPRSPLTPVSPLFTIQPAYLPNAPLYSSPTAPISSPYKDELMRLADTLKVLRLSGWYYENLDWQGARSLLREASIGSFIVRNSGDTKFIFSLSVQTERGPTSVRLHYKNGFFRLDCDELLAKYMPRFRCVVELVQYYISMRRSSANGTVWVDGKGCPHSPVLLKTPLRKAPPSLLHSARLAVHKAIDSNPLTPKLWCAPKHRVLPLPCILKDYLGEYPYSI